MVADLKALTQGLGLKPGAALSSRAAPIGAVSGVTPEPTRTTASRKRRSKRTIGSLAVLPLINASADPEMEYMSDGITETIINNLAYLSRLRVMDRATVFRYKGQQADPQQVDRDFNVSVRR